MKHIPPAGQSMVMHVASPNCPCQPERKTKLKGATSGKRGSHQGYKTEVSFVHKLLETA